MKRLSFLCLLLLLCFSLSVFHDIGLSMVEGFSSGWSLGKYAVDHDKEAEFYTDVALNPKKIGEIVVSNDTTESYSVVATKATLVKLFAKGSHGNKYYQSLDKVFLISSLLLIVLGIWILVLFFIIILSFKKSYIFEIKNLKSITLIGCLFIIIGFISTLVQIYIVWIASKYIILEHYSVSFRDCIAWDSILIGLVVLVFNEILRRAISMKQEQDLTV